MRLVFQSGRLAERSPQSTAVVIAHGQGASIAESTCRFVLFSASRDEGRRWLTDRPAVRGTVVPLRAALLLAQRVFNDRWPRPPEPSGRRGDQAGERASQRTQIAQLSVDDRELCDDESRGAGRYATALQPNERLDLVEREPEFLRELDEAEDGQRLVSPVRHCTVLQGQAPTPAA